MRVNSIAAGEETLSVSSGNVRERKRRIWELDFLRGFTIILMVVDHFMYDLAYMFSDVWLQAGGAAGVFARFAMNWWGIISTYPFDVYGTRCVIQKIAICIFFGLCGGSTAFSRDNAMRSVKTLLAAAVITVGTVSLYKMGVLDEGDCIYFGVLHMLGISTIIVSAVHALCKKAPRYGEWIYIGACALLAGVCFGVSAILDGANLKPEPWLMFLHEGFVSGSMGDYFPLLPNLGIVFAGAAIIGLVYRKKRSLVPVLDGKWNKPFCFVGRHTIFIVIAHQVFNVVLLMLISATFVDLGNFVMF